MFDAKAELLEKIRLGESSFLEFTEVQFAGGRISGPHRNSLAAAAGATVPPAGPAAWGAVRRAAGSGRKSRRPRCRPMVAVRPPRSNDEDAVFLAKLGMAAPDREGTVRPTIAGVLMASPDPRRWLPNAYVQAVAYRGEAIRVESPTTAYQLDAFDATGPLERQVVDACRFVARNMKTAAFKHMGRTDLPQYDMEAVFEALVNAVAHRDYSVHGSKVRLRLFEDRQELYSPGSIPNSLTIESLPYRQSARNEALCSLLARCPIPDEPWLSTPRRHMMERRGEGMPIILENSKTLSGREPKIELFDNAELRLTMYAAQVDAER